MPYRYQTSLSRLNYTTGSYQVSTALSLSCVPPPLSDSLSGCPCVYIQYLLLDTVNAKAVR